VVHLVEALRYKPEGHGCGFIWSHSDFSLA